MKKIILPMLCMGFAVMLAACGTAEEERLTPPDTLPAEASVPDEAENDAEPEEGETTMEEATSTGETTAEETTEAATEAASETEVVPPATTAPLEQNGSWAIGVWKQVVPEDDEMMVFTPVGQVAMLREMNPEWYDEYMRFENGEIILTELTLSAYGELTEITRDEDIDNFRIYTYSAFLEDGLEGISAHYILDKDERLYVLYSGIFDFRYEAAPDSLTLILGNNVGEEDVETIAAEVVDSEHVNLTVPLYDEDETDMISLVKIPHLDAVVHYLN